MTMNNDFVPGTGTLSVNLGNFTSKNHELTLFHHIPSRVQILSMLFILNVIRICVGHITTQVSNPDFTKIRRNDFGKKKNTFHSLY